MMMYMKYFQALQPGKLKCHSISLRGLSVVYSGFHDLLRDSHRAVKMMMYERYLSNPTRCCLIPWIATMLRGGIEDMCRDRVYVCG